MYSTSDHPNSKAARPQYVCKQCGQSFTPKDPKYTTFCGRVCFFAYDREHGRPERRKPHANPKPFLPCVICGNTCPRRGQKVCSAECRKEWAKANARERSASAKEARLRPCRQCGLVFTPEYGNKRRLFCSGDCQRKWARRAARKRYGSTFNERAKAILKEQYGAAWREHYQRISKAKVYNRDHWTCGVCGKPIKRTSRSGYDPLQPSVDHIVPLSLGGEHKYTNVRAAHHGCNSARGNTGSGQPRLLP